MRSRIAGGRAIPALLAAALAWPPAAAQERSAVAHDPRSSGDAARPRLALVLSGGGARGGAHIGVLRLLEELRIPVDLVVGTSMGAIVGGLYAAGMSPEEIETALVETDWSDLLTDKPSRRFRSFRRKTDDVELLVKPKLRLDRGKFRPPLGFIQGQKLDTLLEDFELRVDAPADFDAFFIPFRAVAADLATGEAVVLGEGSLARAIRASMSVPGVFTPVELGGRQLIDGGVAANLPVGVARSLGAERVIAVDVGTPLVKGEPESVLGVLEQLSGFLTQGNVERDVAELRSGDVLIRPDLATIGATRFDQTSAAIPLGLAAAREAAAGLARFAVSEAEWQAFVMRRRARPAEVEPIVGDVVLDNEGPLADDVVLARIEARPGEPVLLERLRRDLLELYGLDYFEPIDLELRRRPDGGSDVILHVKRRRSGLHVMQFGLDIEDDFRGGNAYDLAARYQILALDRRGAEWRNDLFIGNRAGVASEFYRPLDRRLRYFVAPRLEFAQESLPLRESGATVAEALITTYTASLDVGRTLGTWGELRLGLTRGRGRASVRVGFPDLPDSELDEGGLTARLRVDTLDDPAWPRAGAFSTLEYARSVEALGADRSGPRWGASYDHASTFGRTTLLPGLAGARNEALDGAAGPYELGGFGRLSGLAPGDLRGERYFLGRLFVYRELTRRTFRFLEPGLYLGGSLEVGNAFVAGEETTWQSLIAAGSVFVGADTLLGPLYLGYGLAEGGRDRVFLVIGRPRR